MDHNPYKPPVAVVADLQVAPPLTRPRSVTTAIRLSWISFAIALTVGLYGAFATPTAGAQFVGTLTGVLIAFGVAFALNYWVLRAIGRGRNWGRIVFLSVMILSVLANLAVPSILEKAKIPMPTASGFDVAVTVVQYGLNVAASFLMFSPTARPWFEPRD